MATFNGETSIVELSVFAKKQQLDLSFFAKKQSLNQNKKLFSIKLHFSTYIYFVMYFLLSQINPVSVWLKLLAVYNKKVGFVNIYKNGFICFCKWTLHIYIDVRSPRTKSRGENEREWMLYNLPLLNLWYYEKNITLCFYYFFFLSFFPFISGLFESNMKLTHILFNLKATHLYWSGHERVCYGCPKYSASICIKKS